ncbi:MAG: MarR family winged helix-turn-helix transcriptional regulator [Bacteroidia bacterium]
MRIDDAIKTKSFVSEYHRLRVNMLYSAHWLEGEIKIVLDPFGVSQKQFNILRILRGHNGKVDMSILDLKDRMIVASSDVSRMVERMEKKGLVKRKPCTEDKRVTRVKVSDQGLELLASIDSEKHKLDAMLHNLSEEEARVLNVLLDKARG